MPFPVFPLVGVFLGIAILVLVLVVVLAPSKSSAIVSPSSTIVPTVTNTGRIILYDTFTQAGSGEIPLSAHTPEIGGPWTDFNSFPELELILGQGYCTNTTMTIDINQSCVCTYDNLHETLEFKLDFTIPDTITPAGDIAGLVMGFVTDTAYGLTCQFFYDPTNLIYGLQLVQLLPGLVNETIATKFINSPPPLNQIISMTGFMKPAGGLIVNVLDIELSGQGAFSPMVDNFNKFVCAMFRGNQTIVENIRMQEILIKAI